MRFISVAAAPIIALGSILALTLVCAGPLQAQQPAAVDISVKDNRFVPAEISAPANQPIAIRVKNLGAKAVEFESVSLRVEKVVAANSEGTVNIRALQPGRYEFFDDFHQETRGTLVVK